MKVFLRAAALGLGLFFWLNAGAGDTAQAALTAGQPEGLRIYAAQPGDNFLLLGARIGYDPDFLAALNNLSAGYCCQGGELLRLPRTAWVDLEDAGALAEPAAASDRQSGLSLAARGGALGGGRVSAKVWQRPLLEQGVVTCSFGSNRSNSPGHHGVDIAVPKGSPILAVHSGKVLEAGWKNDVYGYAVLIDHGNGWQTLYAHCSSVLTEVGQRVEQGQRIALVGSTGNSTGPHLHLELHKDGVCLDPARYISELSV